MCTVSFLSADHREAVYENLRLAEADVACRFGDTRFTQGSDSPSTLADRGGYCGGCEGLLLGGMLAGDATGDGPGGFASRRGGKEHTGCSVSGTTTAISAIFAGKEGCIAYEAMYN